MLDTLDGKGGTDTLNYNDATGGVDINSLGLSLTSVEVINVRSVGAATATTTAFTGVQNVNVLTGTSAALVVGSTTAASVTGVLGAVAIDGGSTQTVTAGTGSTTITLGATTVAAGAISVTDTVQGANAIAIDGGTTVNVASTGRIASGTIDVGQGGAATDLPTGAVTVNASEGLASGGTAAWIKVNGGSTVAITENITGSAAAIATASTSGAPGVVTGGAITVVGGLATTSVSVTQTKAATAINAVVGATAVAETSVVTFGAMAAAGDSVTVDGLTFTAAKALTAAQVAAAFASLTLGDIQNAGGSTANGVFTGTSGSTDWTTGAATGATVTYTAEAAGTGALAISNTGTATLPVASAPTTGVDASTAKTGVLGVVNGAVTINDNSTAATITTVSVDGYASSTMGGTNTLSKLATLSLSHSGGTSGNASMSVDAAGITSLALNLNAVKGAVTLDAGGASIKTLNVTTATADSAFALTAAVVETLAVGGTKTASFTADLAALKTVTVSDTAGLTLISSDADTITSINTAATTGTVTTFIDPTKATYTGGAGVDAVTTTAIAPTKAIALGGGNDTMTLASGTVAMGTGGTIDGGADTDTLSMVTADAVNASLTTAFGAAVTGFEHVTLTGATGAQTIDVTKLGSYNYVTSAGRTGVADILTIDKLASGGTLAITTAPTGSDTTGSITVNVTDASVAGHITDVLNVVLSNAGDLAAGTVKAAGVETVNITSTDTTTAFDAVHSLTLIDTAAKTITVAGNAGLTLTNAGNTAVTSIDAHTMTGNLTVTAAGTVAETITGGSGNDVLTASSIANSNVAQVSALTFTNGSGNAAMAAGDSIAVTIAGTTVSQVFNTDYATTMAALEVKTEAIPGYTTSFGSNVLTITADVAGTPFTASALMTHATSSITSVYAEGSTNQVFDVDTITFADNVGSGGVMGAGDSFSFTVTPAAGAATVVSQVYDTSFAHTVALMTGQLVAGGYTATDNGTVITITGTAGKGAFTESAITFTDTSTASVATGTAAEGSTNFIADADTLTLTQAVAITAGDTITATVTNGVGTYTTAAVPFHTDYATTMGDLATAIQGLNGAASFTATSNGSGTLITVTDAVTGGSPITAMSTGVVVDQATTLTDAFATTTQNVTSSSVTGDVLNGGAGNDTLVAGNLAQLTGGLGVDTFDMTPLTTNVNSYATIVDPLSGDMIKTTGNAFVSTAIPLGSTAVFQDYANAAINQTASGDVAWFQFGGATYVVENGNGGANNFDSTVDTIIKLTGLVDLTTASFSTSAGTLEFA